LLSEISRLRKDARSARHAYWLPLVLFGLVIGASAPLYVLPPLVTSHGHLQPLQWSPIPPFPGFSSMLGEQQTGETIYWVIAIGAGLYVTWLWYMRHGRRVGLTTPTRWVLIAGVIAGLLVLVLPTFEVVPGDLIVRGTLPFLIVAAALLVLAWAERSVALAIVATTYSGAAVLASLYDVENIVMRLGWNPSFGDMRFSTLPNILLPALVLLVSGAGAYAVQRRRRSAA